MEVGRWLERERKAAAAEGCSRRVWKSSVGGEGKGRVPVGKTKENGGRAMR